MRVVMVIQRFRPHFTGQGVQLEQLCLALARCGIHSTIVTAITDEQVSAEDHEGHAVRRLRCDLPGLRWTARSNRFWMPAFALHTFLWLWRHRRAVDLIHVHGLTDALYGALLFRRLCKVPVIYEMTLLGADDPVSIQTAASPLRRLRDAWFRRCDAYVAMSPALADAYTRAAMPPSRLSLIPQGVDGDRFAPVAEPQKRSAVRVQLGLAADAPTVLFIGSLVRRKGIDVILAAWPTIQASVPDARLVLLGRKSFPENAEAEQELRAALARLSPSAAAAVLLPGVRDDPERWLRAADVFAFPSRREGFGSVIIEAMATGVPAVVARMPGITEFIFERPAPPDRISDDADGVIVEQEDPRGLALAVTELLASPKLAGALGAAGRRRARTRFSMEVVAGRYRELYAATAAAENGVGK